MKSAAVQRLRSSETRRRAGCPHCTLSPSAPQRSARCSSPLSSPPRDVGGQGPERLKDLEGGGAPRVRGQLHARQQINHLKLAVGWGLERAQLAAAGHLACVCVCVGGWGGGGRPHLGQRTDRSTIDPNRSRKVGNQRSMHSVTLMPAEVPVSSGCILLEAAVKELRLRQLKAVPLLKLVIILQLRQGLLQLLHFCSHLNVL